VKKNNTKTHTWKILEKEELKDEEEKLTHLADGINHAPNFFFLFMGEEERMKRTNR
jgi:hypothetical protein